MGKFTKEYIEKIKALLDLISADESSYQEAAKIMADAIEGDGRIFAWGSTHSSTTMQDIYLRAGGLMVIPDGSTMITIEEIVFPGR